MRWTWPGLWHSDVNNLRRSDVKGDHIEVTTVKTADSISIELNKITEAILEKYKDTPFKDYKAMKPYIDIVDSIKASSMAKFDGLI